MQSASNLCDRTGLRRGHQAVNAVRHSPDVNPFDICRADVIYFASTGDRVNALLSAATLRDASRAVPDIQLACRGLRNAAEVFFAYGETSASQSLLHEARLLAVELQYFSQIAWSDIRLAELCLYDMDTDGAESYLASAVEIMVKNRLSTPLISADIHLFDCWTAIAIGDFARAQRSARVVMRRLASQKHGTGLFTRLAVKIATHGGSFSSEVRKSINTLKGSVGSQPFNPNEQLTLAAILLATRNTPFQRESSDFVTQQFSRIIATGRRIWPLVLKNSEN